MANKTGEIWHITIPAMPLPFISSPAPIELNIPIETLKTGLRLVVIISTYLLFRPQIERIFKKAMGMAEEAPTAREVQERMKVIEKERGVPLGGGKKVYAVATPNSKTSNTSGVAKGSSETKVRRKA